MNNVIYRQWTQPILTENGSLGGATFAVRSKDWQSNGDANSGDAYFAFSTGNRYWRSGSNPSFIILYNPTPIKIRNIYCRAHNVQNATYGHMTSGAIYGSNDNARYVKIRDFTNGKIGAYTVNVNSPDFYKYYKIEAYGPGDCIHLAMRIDAIYRRYVSVNTPANPPDKIEADYLNNLIGNTKEINNATGNRISYNGSYVSNTNKVSKVPLDDLRNAINNLSNQFANNCCQNVYNDCCESCQACQTQTCQSSSCQSQCNCNCNCRSRNNNGPSNSH